MRLFGTERRACAFIAAVALLALLLAACTGHGSGTETDGPDGTEREPEDVITASELAGYKFISAEDCGSELGKAFVALHESFNKIAGVATEKSDDFYREGVPELEMKECEILIGGTNRPESKKFLSGLRSDDYGYALIGKKLAIAGRTEANTVKAIEAFEENVLSRFEKNGAAGTFMSSGDNYTFGAEYSVDSVDLCGTDIGKWTVVYPKKDTMGEAVAAERTRDIIASHCGFTVDVIRDDMAPADLENVISVGITAFTSDALADGLKKAGSGATSSAFIGYDGKTVLVGGKDSASLLAAVDSLGKELSDAAARDGRSVTLTLDAEKTYDVADTMLTAMSFNNLVSSKSAERTERVTEMVLKYMPDTIGFQETSSDWMNSLIAKLKGVYAWVGEGRNGGSSGEYNPIFYNKSKFELKESGTHWMSDTPDVASKFPESTYNRIYTYALLERKSDGKKIMIVNTHLDHKSEPARVKQIKVLLEFIEKYRDYPIVLSGDFNTTPSSNVYSTVTKSFMKDSADVAMQAKRASTFTNYGKSDKTLDYLFVNPAKMSVAEYSVCNEKINGDYPSDHHPVLIKYSVLD